MNFLEILIRFMRDDMLITAFVLGGAMLITGWCPRKSFWQLRIAAAFLAAAGWMIATGQIPASDAFGFAFRGLVRYLGLFTISALSLPAVFRCGIFTSMYAVTISYGLQNMCEHIVEIPRGLMENFPLLADRGLLLLLLAASLVLFCQVAVWNGRYIRYLGFEDLDRRVVVYISVAVVMLCIVLDVLMRPIQARSTADSTALLNLLMAICSALAVVTATAYRREADSDRRASIAIHMLSEERERYTREKAAQDAINIRCHDIRHQIAALGQEGYRSSLKELDKLVRIYDDSINTGSTALDVVLSEKMLICEARNICLTCLADGARLQFLPDGDVFALFGNILDNAISAVQNISEPDRRVISLTVRAEDGFLLIEEENRYLGTLEFSNGLPKTTNADRENHGFGMQSIRTLVDRCEGSLRVSAEDGIFALSIMFPICEK